MSELEGKVARAEPPRVTGRSSETEQFTDSDMLNLFAPLLDRQPCSLRDG